MINNLKNIIFDVGDVLLDYRPLEMLMEIGVSKEEAARIDNEMFVDPLWRILDLGTMSQEEIIEGFCSKFPKDADIIRWFIEHGEKMHIPRPKVWKRVHLLKEKGYGIYILSNYSEILFQKHTKGASFMQDADGIVVSYQIHHSKPDPAIYQYLLQKYQLDAAECIFFDDREENVSAAIKLGISATRIESQNQLIQILDQILANKSL